VATDHFSTQHIETGKQGACAIFVCRSNEKDDEKDI
jgi:hypothetical protein